MRLWIGGQWGPPILSVRENAMSKYRVEALEKFIVRTTYYVEAKGPKQAEALCRQGKAAYEDKAIEEGDEEWLETVAVERCE
jgi:hypothetical protein